MQRLKEVQTQIEGLRAQANSERLSLSELKESSIPQTLVFDFLSPYGFTSAQCRQIAKGCSERVGAMYESAEYLCVRDRSELVVGRKPHEIDSLEIPMGREKIELPNRGFLCLKRCKKEDFCGIPQASNVVYLDLHHITFPLFVRTPREGDRFTPFGMKGTQLISDYLTDRKRNRIEKRSALLLSDAQGPIWLMNERPDQRVVITEKTQEVLLIEWMPKS
jgi:tRNA(Ile)-lysidine synthase